MHRPTVTPKHRNRDYVIEAFAMTRPFIRTKTHAQRTCVRFHSFGSDVMRWCESFRIRTQENQFHSNEENENGFYFLRSRKHMLHSMSPSLRHDVCDWNATVAEAEDMRTTKATSMIVIRQIAEVGTRSRSTQGGENGGERANKSVQR